jgi:hypothetical protein
MSTGEWLASPIAHNGIGLDGLCHSAIQTAAVTLTLSVLPAWAGNSNTAYNGLVAEAVGRRRVTSTEVCRLYERRMGIGGSSTCIYRRMYHDGSNHAVPASIDAGTMIVATMKCLHPAFQAQP